jgi:HD-like signal output (HDOD) protein
VSSVIDPQLLAPNLEADELIRRIGIPPRPATLTALQQETRKEAPDMRLVARLVASDVALTAGLLRLVNSSAYGLQRKCASVEQATAMLGLRQMGVLITDLMLRKVLRTDGPQLIRFWDVSSKRSIAMRALAKDLGGVAVDLAHTFGLFCDVGIALLLQRFPDYGRLLKDCNDEPVRAFTEVEQAAIQTDHALVGALMAKTWGVSEEVCAAIRLHHDYTIFRSSKVPEAVSRLVAMGLLADLAIQRFARLNASMEWTKGGDFVAGALMLSDQDVEDWVERLLEEFSLDVS